MPDARPYTYQEIERRRAYDNYQKARAEYARQIEPLIKRLTEIAMAHPPRIFVSDLDGSVTPIEPEIPEWAAKEIATIEATIETIRKHIINCYNLTLY